MRDWGAAAGRGAGEGFFQYSSPNRVTLADWTVAGGVGPGAWDSISRGSAIRRAGRAGSAGNVCVGLGNWGSPEAVAVLTSTMGGIGAAGPRACGMGSRSDHRCRGQIGAVQAPSAGGPSCGRGGNQGCAERLSMVTALHISDVSWGPAASPLGLVDMYSTPATYTTTDSRLDGTVTT